MTFQKTALIRFIPLLLATALVSAKSGPHFVWLSDLHFDPTADPKLVNALNEAPWEDWARIFASSETMKVSEYRQDTNWALFASMLDAVRGTTPDAAFTMVTGDTLVHNFNQKFRNAASKNDDESFRRFSAKTVQFVTSELRTILPGKPVILALGNNDDDCGDYALQPNGPFLKDSSSAVEQSLGPLIEPTTISDWISSGNYDIRYPTLKRVRLLVLNTTYFSPRYKNACSTGTDDDPAKREMQWLSSNLANAREHRDKVWLVFHIPPGVDGYSTARQAQGGAPKTVFLWKAVYTEEFQRLLTAYGKTVLGSFAGHEHMDDFRLLGESLIQGTPAVSPVVGQNPAFRVVFFRANGALSDEQTYYLSNFTDAVSGARPVWKLEYDFDKTWRLPSPDLKSYRKLYRQIETDAEVRHRWTLLYSVSRLETRTATEQTFSKLFCATGNAGVEAYAACLKRVEK